MCDDQGFKGFVLATTSDRHPELVKSLNSGTFSIMPMIKLNRINKGGEILLNSEHVVFIEMESRSTTVHLSDKQLFSVEESPAAIAGAIEHLESARIKNALIQSGVGGKSSA